MDKRFLGRIFVAGAIVAAAVLWLLTVIPATAEMFSWFNLAWAGAIISGSLGAMYVIRGAFSGSDVTTKKFFIWFGAAFLVVTVFCISWAIAMPKDLIAPIIAIVLTGALFAGIFFTGGKSWDGGDNQVAGYKNYHARKAEEKHDAEKAEKEAAKDN